MRTEPSLHLPISWTPLLRLTHERGRPHHDVITIAHTGEGVSRALMAPGQALELQERRSAERCRIEPTADAASGWQLVNDSPDLVCGVWVGYDDNRSIGATETGGKAAVPIWVAFMQAALEGVPPRDFDVPPGVVFVKGQDGGYIPAKPQAVGQKLSALK